MPTRTERENATGILNDAPKLYAVIIHNDDYTPMEFVVGILMRIFRKPAEEANAIMLAVHTNGSGVAGVYPQDIAATKKAWAEQAAADNEYPLRFSLAESGEYRNET